MISYITWNLDGEEPFVSDVATHQRCYRVFGHVPAECVRSVRRPRLHEPASTSRGGMSPAAIASCTVLTGTTTGG